MEYRIMTSVEPRQVLDRAERYFGLDWRYGGNYQREDRYVKLIKSVGLIQIALSVIGLADDVDVAQVAVFPEEDGKTLVLIGSNRRDWAEALKVWAETTLGGEEVSAI